MNTGYFLLDGPDFDSGQYTTPYEIRTMLQAMSMVMYVNTLNTVLTALTSNPDPVREEAIRVKQDMINRLVDLRDRLPYSNDRMAASLAEQLFDPNVGVFTSGYATGTVTNDIDVAKVIIDYVRSL